MRNRTSLKIVLILLTAVILGFLDIPSEKQTNILPFLSSTKVNEDTGIEETFKALPKAVRSDVNLGLDLQGGSQLDYKIDLSKVEPKDKDSIVNGVQEVIEKRVNGLGVTEPNIYQAQVANETHIIVEIAENGTISQEDVDTYMKGKTVAELTDNERKVIVLEKAKATVGKTILLEFKVQNTEKDPNLIASVTATATDTLNKIKAGEDLVLLGSEAANSNPGKVSFQQNDFKSEDDIADETLKATLNSLKVNETSKDLVTLAPSYEANNGQIKAIGGGLSIVQLVDKKTKIVEVKDEDKSKATTTDGKTIDTTATATTDKSSKETTSKDTKDNQVLDKIKTTDTQAEKDTNNTKPKTKEITLYKYNVISYSTEPEQWKDTELTGKYFVHADVQFDTKKYQPYVQIKFDEEGSKIFEKLTEENVGKPIAIFVGGELISAPNVNEKISGGTAIISGGFDHEGALKLARNLNTGAIPAPIILTGEYTIGATLGHEALNKSLQAGVIGLLFVMLFMLFNYRVAGLAANLALLVYGAILVFLIKVQLPVLLAISIALAILGYLVIKIINDDDSGWEKTISLMLSFVGFLFLIFLLTKGVVLTLASVAGIILSIGMAVDANILIFERFKEEARTGKTYASSLETGFNKAWTAIKDSNFSTLFICAILFFFGSSIIKGFAFNLAAGVLVSMFTAVIITKTLLQGFIGTKLSKNLAIFGLKKEKKSKFGFVKRSKIWLSISGIMVAVSIAAIVMFGLKLGIDFKGGTLLEFNFDQEVTKEQIATTFKEIETKLNETASTQTMSPDQSVINETVDFKNIQILPSKENFIIKTKYMSSETHDKIIEMMKEKLPSFTEERFTTIGATVGKTLLSKALKAIIISLIVIILYIGFAFRKVPKHVNPWKFGAIAITALAHDVIIVTGIFAILGKYLNVEIDALFITAILTVFGYSVNDTIVIFDRIRENLISSGKGEDIKKVVDTSLNETFNRSINTSLSTIITLIAVLLLGSSSIFYFVLALTLGTIVGTYSSIFTAAPLLIIFNKEEK